MVHNEGRSDKAYSGVVGWSAFDYGSGRKLKLVGPEKMKKMGVFDTFRIPKLGSAVYRAQIAREPVIEPSFYWRFDGEFDVKKLRGEALIWTNLERAVLHVDGKQFKSVVPARNDKRFQHLQFPPMAVNFRKVSAKAKVLRIDGYKSSHKNSRVAASRSFGRDYTFKAFALTNTLRASDVSDSVRIEFGTYDQFDNLQPDTGGSVTVTVSGPAELLGEASLPIPVGAVWVRSIGQAGAVTVTIRSNGGGSASVTIVAK